MREGGEGKRGRGRRRRKERRGNSKYYLGDSHFNTTHSDAFVSHDGHYQVHSLIFFLFFLFFLPLAYEKKKRIKIKIKTAHNSFAKPSVRTRRKIRPHHHPSE